MKRAVAVSMALAAVAIAGCGGGSGSSAPASTSSPTGGAAAAPTTVATAPTNMAVVYEAGDYDASTQTPDQALQDATDPLQTTVGKVNVTYTDLTDDTTQQATVTTPWQQSFTSTQAGAGTAQVEVQDVPGQISVGGSYGVYCAIKVGGKVVDVHGTTGDNIATCKASM